MNLKVRNFDVNQYLPKKLQEGGTVDPNAAAPAEAPVEEAPQGGGDPMQELLMACQQVLETQDCNLAMQVIQAVMQMLGGGAPEGPAAPEGQAPVFRKGGKFAGWINK